jgi:hypothetical protein
MRRSLLVRCDFARGLQTTNFRPDQVITVSARDAAAGVRTRETKRREMQK